MGEPTITPIACCGLNPNASSVLPVDHAETQAPETVQYPAHSRLSQSLNKGVQTSEQATLDGMYVPK
jgi:hypothetical protein